MTKDESTPSAVHFGSNCEHSNDSFTDLSKHATVHGESQWLNINSKIMKEKKKFNADVSDLLVLEVLKRKELLIENNTSRDLTFSESKRNAWNDVRGLLMDKFPYFDLNVEAIKSHWRYRKRKVTDIYQDLKCSKSESSILSKISTIDRAIYEMLVDSNMLDSKGSKHEVSTVSLFQSEGEEQSIENVSAPDHSSSISPASAFTTPNNASLFFQPQYYQRQSTVQNNHSHNRNLQTAFGGSAFTLQQQIQQLLQNAAERSQPQPQSNLLGFNSLAEINVPPTNLIANPLVPIFGTATGTQHQNAALMQKLFLLFQQQEQQQRVQQQEQSLLLNSPESTNSPDVEEAPKVENVGRLDAVRAGNSYDEHESTIDMNNNIDGEVEFEPEVKNDCSNLPSIILQTVAGAEKFGTDIQAALRLSAATADSRRKRHTRSPPSVTVLRSQKTPKRREDEMEATSVENSIETQALMAQHSAFAELESFVIELKRLVVPEAIKALKNYNSTFVRPQGTNQHYKTSDHPSID